MFFQAPRNPTSDMRKITPPRAMTGIVKDRLHSSLWVLIQNPKPTTSRASIMVKKLIHLMTNALALPILRPSLPHSQISRVATGSCTGSRTGSGKAAAEMAAGDGEPGVARADDACASVARFVCVS
uniref:Uncharacterized protein n=1 Tax=Arundo donax TaxID=35708 RepID=A0A0A9GJ44_ARUDO